MAGQFFISSFLIGCVISVGFAAIPEYIHICHRSDPKVGACIKDSVEFLRPYLVKGIPEVNVPPIDPIKFDKIVIFDGVSTPNLNAYLANIEATGLSKFEITKLKLDVDKMTYLVGVKFPFLEMHGDYSVDAKILAAPIKSQGQFHANVSGIQGQGLIQGYIGEGTNRLLFSSISLKLKISDFNLDLENFLNNDPVLGQAARSLVSGNKDELIRISTPYIERKASEVLLELANRITEHLDYDEVFPLSSYLHVCKRTDPQLDDCIINDIITLMPKLKNGIPELNAPALEPLVLDTVKLRSGPNRAKIDADLTDLKLYGISDLKILSLKSDIPNKLFTAKIALPRITFIGNYDIDINVLILKYQGKGEITGNLTDYGVEIKLSYNIITNDGKEYMNLVNFKLSLIQGKSVIMLDGLLRQGNTAFAKGMIEVLKDNTDLFVTEIMPNLEEGLNVKLIEIANNITHQFPYDELFLP
ncbi:circadian clock-controlled protein daywake-like [Anthonomus grandis grandis]|uniref:circadian clock-controlled protein daywake-like n=1 Tax=Anthonomus grandis grandis TaxID=2921223 RepID=UPI00216542D1|nr:circadian clock-controlled protein daywake-like [Anthonomus grandis grandis]